jgi:hypothetical protein
LECTVSLLGRRGDDFLLETLYGSVKQQRQEKHEDGFVVIEGVDEEEKVVRGGESRLGAVDPSDLGAWIYRLAALCQRLSNTDGRAGANDDQDRILLSEQTPASWMHSLSKKYQQNGVSLHEFKDWALHTAPALPRLLSTLFHHALLGSTREFQPRPAQTFRLPHADSGGFDSSSWTTSSESGGGGGGLLALAAMDLGGPWRRIYGSDVEGLSFAAFQRALTIYAGPTCTLVQTTAGSWFGYFTEVPWKPSPNWCSGGGESFLFSLKPDWNVYRAVPEPEGASPWKKARRFRQFLHVPGPHRKAALAGLAIGGLAADAPRLHINPSMERCKACSFDSFFEPGPLLGDDAIFFDVERLEVWAVRIEDEETYRRGVAAGELRRACAEQLRLRQARVDREQFVDDFSSGAYMSHLYDHRSQCRGRAEFVVSDDEGHGYFLEGKEPSDQYRRGKKFPCETKR